MPVRRGVLSLGGFSDETNGFRETSRKVGKGRCHCQLQQLEGFNSEVSSRIIVRECTKSIHSTSSEGSTSRASSLSITFFSEVASGTNPTPELDPTLGKGDFDHGTVAASRSFRSSRLGWVQERKCRERGAHSVGSACLRQASKLLRRRLDVVVDMRDSVRVAYNRISGDGGAGTASSPSFLFEASCPVKSAY